MKNKRGHEVSATAECSITITFIERPYGGPLVCLLSSDDLDGEEEALDNLDCEEEALDYLDGEEEACHLSLPSSLVLLQKLPLQVVPTLT